MTSQTNARPRGASVTARLSVLHHLGEIHRQLDAFLEELHYRLARFNAHGEWEAQDVEGGDEAGDRPPDDEESEEPHD